jgi:hypothetical protein
MFYELDAEGRWTGKIWPWTFEELQKTNFIPRGTAVQPPANQPEAVFTGQKWVVLSDTE